MKKKVAIIGAGLSGAILANRLESFSEVTIFEKSRGTGGRISSCRLGVLSADLGAPCFNPVSIEFRQWLEQQSGVTRWLPRTYDFDHKEVNADPLYAASNRQSALTRNLCSHATLNTGCRVASVEPELINNEYKVTLSSDINSPLGQFDIAIITAPAIQANPLLKYKPDFTTFAERAITTPSWVVAVTIKGQRSGADMYCGRHPVLNRCTKDSSKPGRQVTSDTETWVLEATPEWSAEHSDGNEKDIFTLLFGEFCKLINEVPAILFSRTHRWLLARHRSDTTELFLWDNTTGIGACGDWLSHHGSEGSWLSANALTDEILRQNS